MTENESDSFSGVHPSFEKLFRKVYEIMDEIEERDQPATLNRSLSSSKKDMCIQKNVINLNMGQVESSSRQKSLKSSRTLNMRVN